MFRPARWFTYASFFAIALGACGSEDEGPRDPTVQDPVKTCTTLENLPCSCPGGGYGVYACDGSCLMCPSAAAGRGAAGTTAGTGAAGAGMTGFAGRGGGAAGRMSMPPPAGAPGPGPAPAGMGGPAGAPAPMAGAPAAGSGGMPMAGAMAGAAGSGGTTTGDVPATPVCMPVSMWNSQWTMFEVEVLRLVNENRAKGWNCDTEGMFPAAGPLTMEPTLRCSARLHSKDMADQMYFAHDGLDGRNPGARMTAAGYVGRTWGENIAKGQQSPAQVVSGWMDSDGHCSNIMNKNFTLIGVGYFAGMGTNPRFNSELYWTQNFGAAAGGRR
jgi:uncharacterized protein YkwD